MAKKVSKKRNVQSQQKQTNWLLIGGIVGIGVIGLFALLFLSLQDPAAPELLSLEQYCQDNPDNCVTEGSADAPVTIVEISDYGCIHCRDFYTQTEPSLKEQYVDSGKVRYIVVPFALSTATYAAANGGLCAAEQDRYFEYGHAMFAQYDDADARQRDGIERAGQAAGLDMAQFTECLNQSRYNNVLQQNIQAVGDAGVSSTPNFFVNGQHIEGAQPFAAFQQQIDALLNS
ncbi:MAG: DsbA family protein [Ardenticatenaceae bacterium]|nr:DsbA family protein [Ardenticatenaceae bacterium]MCB9444773.1 DsbA family protein [Ardenticatenaceae bacterium]